jgi:hypothetical protein
MEPQWVVKTANGAEAFQEVLNSLERDYYKVTFLTAKESGEYVVVARMEK